MTAPYISEVKYLGGGSLDFVEIAATTGTDMSNVQVIIYNSDGTVRTTNSVGLVVTTIAGRDVYVIDTATSATFNGLHKFGAVALVNNGTVTSFISFNDGPPVTATEGPASGMTSTQIGLAGSGESLETTDEGATYSTQTTPNDGTIPCFVTDTMILTDQGTRAIQELSTGDMVVTKDHGLQPIRWVGKKVMAGKDACLPVCIKANSFGPDLPSHDLFVSPNHRLLVSNYHCSMYFGEREVLAAAKFLIDGRFVENQRMNRSYAYYHMLFDQHEIVRSNNLETESFHPGKCGLDGFDEPVREELFGVFPELRTMETSYGHTARSDLKHHEAVLVSDFLQRRDYQAMAA